MRRGEGSSWYEIRMQRQLIINIAHILISLVNEIIH